MSNKKLYIRIEAGEEGYYFTKEEGLRFLSAEYNRIAKENKQDDSEFAYEWDWVWITEEEYNDYDREIVDKPRFDEQSPSPGVEVLVEALEDISDWKLPATGKFWDEEKTRPTSYETEYGSNGVRDYIKSIARKAVEQYNNLKQ